MSVINAKLSKLIDGIVDDLTYSIEFDNSWPSDPLRAHAILASCFGNLSNKVISINPQIDHNELYDLAMEVAVNALRFALGTHNYHNIECDAIVQASDALVRQEELLRAASYGSEIKCQNLLEIADAKELQSAGLGIFTGFFKINKSGLDALSESSQQ